MTITVLFFGHYQDVAGDERRVETESGVTLETLLTQIGANDPPLSNLIRVCRFAVNEEYAPLETVLADGDTVAVLPPMSGG